MFKTSRFSKIALLSMGILTIVVPISKLSLGQKNELPTSPIQTVVPIVNPTNGVTLLFPAPAFSDGMLAFGDYKRVALTGKRQWASFLELRKVKGTSVVSSSLKVADLLHAIEPQFSPDGKSLLCKVGASEERYEKYKIAFVDMESKKFSYGPNGISYLKILWSPNSKYVAYVKGGDAEGNQLSAHHPLELFIYNVQTKKEKMIAQNSLVTQFCWTPDNSLLFCQQTRQSSQGNANMHSSVYEVEAESGLPHLLLTDAFEPQPSPDNQKIAFFSWSSGDQKPRSAQPTLGLYIYTRKDSNRNLLRFNFSYIQFLGCEWTLDSRSVLFLQQIEQSPNAKSRLSIVDLSDRKVRQIAIITAKDFSQFVRSRIQPQFKIMGLSKNGNYVYLNSSEYIGQDDPYLIDQISLISVDITTGKSYVGAEILTRAGVDWKNLAS